MGSKGRVLQSGQELKEKLNDKNAPFGAAWIAI